MRAIDYFDKSAESHAERIALTDGDVRLTYREVSVLTHGLARAMRSRGLTAQEPAAICSPNHHLVLVCALGLWRARAAWVPVNTRNHVDANIQFLNYVRATWLFYHSSYSVEAHKIRDEVPSIRHMICLDCADAENTWSYDFIQEGDNSDDVDWCDPFGNIADLMGIIPTGGTTGPAKGVMMNNLGWGAVVETAMSSWHAKGHPVCLVSTPLTHAAGAVAMIALAMGATVIVMPSFDALSVSQSIERYRVTHMVLPPTALYAMLDHPRVGEFDYSSLKVFLLAAAPVSPQKLKDAVEVFGPCMCQCYGQTECPFVVTWLAPNVVAAAARGIHPERLASCGRSTQTVRVGVMDDAGNILPPNTVGELVVRGPLVSPGYFNLPDATDEARTYGWHHTGDLGYRDESGFFYIVDRQKDMIITGGFNVFAAEVEAAVMEMPQVRECAVVGIPHEKWGEAVAAIVGLASDATITGDVIIAHCKMRLGSVKAPKIVEFWPEVPRTPVGKFDKKAIRSRYWSGQDRNVH